MSVFVLKIIAMIAMVFDHTGYVIFHHFSWMNYIGRFAFPIFAFLITEGYAHTKNLKKYFLRLTLFAFLSQIPFALYMYAMEFEMHLNILFTLLLGLLVIYVYEMSKPKWLGLLFAVISCAFAYFAHFDYGWFGIAIIFVFHLLKDKKICMACTFSLLTFSNYLIDYFKTNAYEYFIIILFCIASLIPIFLYNGKKGKNSKYFFYFFYPLHLLLLYGLHFLF